MKVKIKETGEIEDFSIIDPDTGMDWTWDFVGSAGALDDGQFSWDKESSCFITDQFNYDWWDKLAACHEAADKRKHAMKLNDSEEEYVMNAISAYDITDIPRTQQHALDEIQDVRSM